MAFLPDNYSVPASGGKYFKPASGTTRLRILSEPVLGYEGWVRDGDRGVPHRVRMDDQDGIAELRAKVNQNGKPEDRKISHFWAVTIFTAETEEIQVWQIRQATIQEALLNLARDEDWGDCTDYWIKLTKSGEGMDTKYSVVPAKKAPLSETVAQMVEQTPVNLDALFSGDDPFEVLHDPSGGGSAPSEDDDNIPF